MNKLPWVSRLFGNKVDQDELKAWLHAIPTDIDVNISEEEGRLIASITNIDSTKVTGLLVTEADSHDELVGMINDLIMSYKNVPNQYRSHFNRLLLPGDAELFNQVREGKGLKLVKS